MMNYKKILRNENRCRVKVLKEKLTIIEKYFNHARIIKHPVFGFQEIENSDAKIIKKNIEPHYTKLVNHIKDAGVEYRHEIVGTLSPKIMNDLKYAIERAIKIYEDDYENHLKGKKNCFRCISLNYEKIKTELKDVISKAIAEFLSKLINKK